MRSIGIRTDCGEAQRPAKAGEYKNHKSDHGKSPSNGDLAASKFRGTAVLLKVDPAVFSYIHERLHSVLDLEDLPGLEQLYIGLEQGRVRIDALMLGVSLEEPVRIAQRIHSLGVDIPVLILTEPEHHDQLKHALKFAPFVGNDVLLCSMADFESLPHILSEAVKRVRKRRHYKGSMEAAQVRLGAISGQRPHITHYYERLLDRAPIGVLNININGAILNLNRHACQVLVLSNMK
ncbi:MAG: hypothetical protein ABW155_18905 [Candidatus Thiodiazotropha sp.]